MPRHPLRPACSRAPVERQPEVTYCGAAHVLPPARRTVAWNCRSGTLHRVETSESDCAPPVGVISCATKETSVATTSLSIEQVLTLLAQTPPRIAALTD